MQSKLGVLEIQMLSLNLNRNPEEKKEGERRREKTIRYKKKERRPTHPTHHHLITPPVVNCKNVSYPREFLFQSYRWQTL